MYLANKRRIRLNIIFASHCKLNEVSLCALGINTDAIRAEIMETEVALTKISMVTISGCCSGFHLLPKGLHFLWCMIKFHQKNFLTEKRNINFCCAK